MNKKTCVFPILTTLICLGLFASAQTTAPQSPPQAKEEKAAPKAPRPI